MSEVILRGGSPHWVSNVLVLTLELGEETGPSCFSSIAVIVEEEKALLCEKGRCGNSIPCVIKSQKDDQARKKG